MALELGSGTQADPYLLVNLADVTAWLTTKQTQGYWFALVSDLDFSATNISTPYNNWRWNLDGRGFKLNIKCGYSSSVMSELYECQLKNVWLIINSVSTAFVNGMVFGVLKLNNSVLQLTKTYSGSQKTTVGGTNGLLIEPGSTLGVSSGQQGIYRHGTVMSNTINTNSFSDGNPYNPNNYPSFAPDFWVFDGISLPRPRPQNTADLTTRYAIKGQSKVGGNNRLRNLAVFTENGLRYKVQDTKADGSFFLNLNDVTTPVIILAYDDVGAKAVINTAYSLNQIIHPATPNGFRYRCTLAGNSGAIIPSEPWPTSAVLTIGAAKFTPEPVYEPKAHGPLLPVLFNVITEQPV
ncbi:hypothetical protein NUK55_15055 [Aeromonas veronii]|uniref:hypothetical protein n=1 Tax=Aeromonas veronii TaxID=654 RepID=UPI00214D8497|nr:hypothetical protein [Aeromonas veronii]MCR3972419.1 hypothetical protein [Aeromonas veronii]MCR3973737.1 hypothetical protein [Aeromonas veronii]